MCAEKLEQYNYDTSSVAQEDSVIDNSDLPQKNYRPRRERAVNVERELEKGKRYCEFCGTRFDNLHTRLNPQRRFCSSSCQSKAESRRNAARLAMPLSKRFRHRLKFSSPLYFS